MAMCYSEIKGKNCSDSHHKNFFFSIQQFSLHALVLWLGQKKMSFCADSLYIVCSGGSLWTTV